MARSSCDEALLLASPRQPKPEIRVDISSVLLDPCASRLAVQHSELRRLAPGGGDEVLLLERGAVTAAALADAQATHGSGGQLDLHLLQAGRLGCPKVRIGFYVIFVRPNSYGG